ncbi:hypothetical protein ACJZ2D_017115 [Fusarium nematophilum]
MIQLGSSYGYLTAGKSLIFLHIGDDPTVLYYHMAQPENDAGSEDGTVDPFYTAVAQLAAFCLQTCSSTRSSPFSIPASRVRAQHGADASRHGHDQPRLHRTEFRDLAAAGRRVTPKIEVKAMNTGCLNAHIIAVPNDKYFLCADCHTKKRYISQLFAAESTTATIQHLLEFHKIRRPSNSTNDDDDIWRGGTPAMSAEPERVFPDGSELITDKRNGLGDDTVEAEMIQKN